MDLPPIDPELEQVTTENLEYLKALVEAHRVSHSELRRASVVLRNLISDNQLKKVAQARRHKVTVPIPDTDALIPDVEADDAVMFFQLGGFTVLGVEVSMFIMEFEGPHFGPRERPFEPGRLVERSLDRFKSQPVFYVKFVIYPAGVYLPATTKRGLVSR